MFTTHIARLLILLLLIASGDCFSQDLCSLLEGGRGLAARPDASAFEVLDTIGKVVPFETHTIRLQASSSALVKQLGGAAAKLCGHPTERWIFFDQAYIDEIKPKDGKSDLPRYFVMAHEAAHHINGDTLQGNTWSKDQELAADYSAAVWLARLGVSKETLLQTFDALGFPVQSVNGYPTRDERRAKVIQGWNAGAGANSGPAYASLRQRLESAWSRPVYFQHNVLGNSSRNTRLLRLDNCDIEWLAEWNYPSSGTIATQPDRYTVHLGSIKHVDAEDALDNLACTNRCGWFGIMFSGNVGSNAVVHQLKNFTPANMSFVQMNLYNVSHDEAESIAASFREIVQYCQSSH